ncbi:MAG: phosphatase PAP2 family protein [Gaiellaceae bacterium]
MRRHASRSVALLVLVLVTGSGYLVLNAPTTGAHVLRTRLDEHIPLVPAFVVPYVLFLPTAAAIVLLAFLRGRRFDALALALIAVYAISDAIFLGFPTRVPRSALGGHDVFSRLLRFVYAHDKPYAGFPSEHASTATVLAVYLVVNTTRRWRVVVVGLAALVVASTVLIRQHFLADDLGGVLLGLTATIVALQLRGV